MKIRTFCLYVCLFLFCAFSFGSGSGGIAPTLIFTSWKAGRGLQAGPSNAPNIPKKWYSFATNNETQCKLDVSVGYAMNQPANAYKLTSYEFKVTASISLPGLSEEELKKHTFTFPEQPKQQVAAGSTSFSYSGIGALTEHWHPTGGETEQRKYCPNYTEAKYKPKKTPINGRSLSINIKFIGYYGTDPNNQQKEEILLQLSQETPDRIRQEHIDQGIYVPSYDSFVAGDEYNHGHYDMMLNGGLAGYRRAWLDKVNELHRQCNESHNCEHNKEHGNGQTVCKPPICPVEGCEHADITDFTLDDFSVTSAYRSAHHNRYHVKNSGKHPHGLHQYGYALDIITLDVDGDGEGPNGIEQVKGNQAKSADGDAMRVAAEAAGGYFVRSWESYSTITHADWRDDYHSPWPPRNNSSQKVSSSSSLETSTLATNEPTSTPSETTPTTAPQNAITGACGVHTIAASDASSHESGTYACGVHSGYLCQASSDHGTTISGWGGSFYECQPHQTFACGHTDLTANSYTHRSETCPFDSYAQACSSGSYYACQSHTHDYPNRIDGACGHTYTVGQRSSHELQASCSETNANGDSCTVTSFYACQTHTHVYPVRATCANGHSYDPDISTENNRHRTRTCRWCSQTWQKCVSGAPQCLVKTKRNCWAIE